MITASNKLNWSYNIYIEKCPPDKTGTIKLSGNQGYEQPFGAEGISGSFSGATCYTIEFDLNFIKDTARLVNGRLVIYNLPTSLYQKVLYNGSGLVYKETGAILAGAEVLFLKLTLSYRGYTSCYNFKVNSCYTTGFPDRKTFFELEGMGGLDRVTLNNRKNIEDQSQSLPKETETGVGGQSLLQTKLYWAEQYLKKYKPGLTLSDQFYTFDDLYEKIPYPNCDTLWGAFDTLFPDYSFYENNNQIYLVSKNDIQNRLGKDVILDEEAKNLLKIRNNKYVAYFNLLPALVINEYYDTFHNLPYWDNQLTMSISTPLRFDILPTRKVQLKCMLRTTKILSAQPTYLCSGVRHYGKFSQVNGAKGASEIDLQVWNKTAS